MEKFLLGDQIEVKQIYTHIVYPTIVPFIPWKGNGIVLECENKTKLSNLPLKYAEGQLGYTSVDTQATPRRVSSLKAKIVAVAAANKHTAVVSDSGEVFTWGCNKKGQLGYGTSNSASNYTPRVVEYLKGKVFVAVSAAKYHTVVLGADGEVRRKCTNLYLLVITFSITNFIQLYSVAGRFSLGVIVLLLQDV